MSIFVNAPEQEAFLLITDHFASKSMKIVTSSPPSHIRAEFGSWTSISLDNAKGEVEVEITKRNGGSYTNLNFNFFKEYLFALIIAIFATLLLCVMMWWRATRDMSHIAPAEVGNFLFRISLITVGLSAVMFVVAIGLVGYSTSLTRKRFIEEFNMFVRSLPFQKG
jgi:small-conductance mechanosensitive channel